MKPGQKVFFDRNAIEVKRSNTNGNYGTYKLFQLLIELNPQDNFYILSESDLTNTTYPNAYPTCSNINSLDCIIILPGMILKPSDKHLLYSLLNYIGKIIILSDDPRCLRSTLQYLYKMPSFIGMQNNGFIVVDRKLYQGHYVPLELATCYKLNKPTIPYKTKNIIAIANTTPDHYRTKVLNSIIGEIKLPIYGRLSEEEVELLGKEKCIGEVEYNEMQNILASSMSTILIPIEKGLVTSKYIEAIINKSIPIFHKDYNIRLLGLEDYPYVVENSEDLKNALNEIKKNPNQNYKLLDKLYYSFVETNINGKKLNKLIYSYISR